MCWAITTVQWGSFGNNERIFSIWAGPPVDAPTRIRQSGSKGFKFAVEFFGHGIQVIGGSGDLLNITGIIG